MVLEAVQHHEQSTGLGVTKVRVVLPALPAKGAVQLGHITQPQEWVGRPDLC